MENKHNSIKGDLRDALLNNNVLSTRSIILLLSSKTGSRYYKDMLTIINALFHIGINNKNDVIDRILPYITHIEQNDFDNMNAIFVENFLKNCKNLNYNFKDNTYQNIAIMKSYKYSSEDIIIRSLTKMNKFYTESVIKKIIKKYNDKLNEIEIIRMEKNIYGGYLTYDNIADKVYILAEINEWSINYHYYIDFIGLLEMSSFLCMTDAVIDFDYPDSLICPVNSTWIEPKR